MSTATEDQKAGAEAAENADEVLGGNGAQKSDRLKADDLPPALEDSIDDLNAAIDSGSKTTPAKFPEDENYPVSDEARQIAHVLIPVLHEHLKGARIAYLFRQNIVSSGEVSWGKAQKVGAKWHALSDLNFVLEFNWEVWVNLSRRQRVRLVDHELSHCGFNRENGAYESVPHDVEEFVGIVDRWGLVESQMPFGRSVQQLDLDLEF